MHSYINPSLLTTLLLLCLPVHVMSKQSEPHYFDKGPLKIRIGVQKWLLGLGSQTESPHSCLSSSDNASVLIVTHGYWYTRYRWIGVTMMHNFLLRSPFRIFMNLLVSLCACVMRVCTVCVTAILYALLLLHILTYPHNTLQGFGSYADS